jgi:hypothetical protein
VIASVANIFLWVKENSPQYADFSPYRLLGIGQTPGIVLKEHQNMPFPYTAIGRSRVGLILHGIGLLESKPDILMKFNGGRNIIPNLCSQILDLFKLYSGERPTRAIFKKFKSYDEFLEVKRY